MGAYDYYLQDFSFISANRNRVNHGLKALTPEEYDISSGNRARRGEQVAAQAQAAVTPIVTAISGGGANAVKVTTPATSGTGGYTVTMSHSQQNAYVRANQTRKARGQAQMTEDEYRRQLGLSTTRDANIRYVAPSITGNNKSAASTGNKSTGVSNNLTGSQKIAASKGITPSPAKAVPVKAVPVKATPVQKPNVNTVVVRDAAGSVVRAKPTGTQGVSNNLTGSQKIAAQSKIDASINKPTIARPKPVVAPVTKPTMLDIAGRQFQGALSGYTAKVTAPKVTAKTEISGALNGLKNFGFMGTARAAESSPAPKAPSKDLTALAQKSLIGALGGMFPAIGVASVAGNYLTGKVASAERTQTQKPASGNYQDINGWKLMPREHQDSIIRNNDKAAKVGNTLTSLGASQNTTNQATTAVFNSLNGSKNKLDSANVKVAQYTKNLPTADKIESVLKTIHAEKAITATPFAGLASVGKVYDVVGNQIDKSSSLKSSTAGKYALSSINTQKSVAGALKEGSQEFLKEEYTGLREKPVSKALEYGSYYLGGEVFGILGEGAKAVTASKFAKASAKTAEITAKVASKVEVPILKKGISTTGKIVGGIVRNPIDIGMMGMLGVDTVSKVGSGYSTGGAKGAVKAALEMEKELALGAKGYERGKMAVNERSAFMAIPTAQKLTVQKVHVQEALVSDVEVGKTLAMGDRPVISIMKDGGLKIGTPEIPESVLKGNRIQTYSKRDTRMLEKTIRNRFSPEDQSLYFSGKKIAETAFRQKSPVTEPESLEISSKNIPDRAKPIVKQTIMEYAAKPENEVIVYGSVAQKMQMKGFFSRQPKDLEISVDGVGKFVDHFRSTAKSAGLVEGQHYRVTVDGKAVDSITESHKPKIEFREGNEWLKGVEVFKDTQESGTVEINGDKYKPEDGIPFGFKSLSPIKVEGIDLLKLQEQATKKFEGSTTVYEGRVQPKHQGRVKDRPDLVEIGVANEATFRTGIQDAIVDYTKTVAKIHPEALKKSPTVDFIVAKSKVPSRAEALALNSNAIGAVEKGVILKALERKAAGELVRSPTRTIRSGSEIAVGETKTSIAAKAKKGIADMMASEDAKLGRTENGKVTESKLKTDFTRRRERELTKGKEVVEADRELLFDSKSKSKAELSKELSSKGLSSKGISSIPMRISSVKAVKANDDSKPKATADKMSSKPKTTNEQSKGTSRPIIKQSSSRPTIKPQSSKPITSKPVSKPSKPINVPSTKPITPPASKPVSKPIITPPSKPIPSVNPPSKPISKPITPPSKPVSPPTDNSKPSVDPDSKSDKTDPTYHDYIVPPKSYINYPEELIGGEGGVPLLPAGSNDSIHWMGRRGLISKTKVKTFSEMVGSGKKTGMLTKGLSLRPATSNKKTKAKVTKVTGTKKGSKAVTAVTGTGTKKSPVSKAAKPKTGNKKKNRRA